MLLKTNTVPNQVEFKKGYKKLELNYCLYLQKLFPYLDVLQTETGPFIILKQPINIGHLSFFLKYHTNAQFKVLVDICASDYPDQRCRFELIYNFLSVTYGKRLNIIVYLENAQTHLSLTAFFSSANWIEREIWDFFGIFFYNHNDLRRILTDYGFKGHPLRKDFPLSGYIETLYNDFDKKIDYVEVSLPQKYRAFSLTMI